jgi:hypothetical protein
MSAVRFLLLVLGIIAVVFGAAMYTENSSYLEICDSPHLDPVREENCRVAAGNVLFGLLSMVVGTTLLALGAVSIAYTWRIRRTDAQVCPHCHTEILRQSSPKNCSNCGSQVDWSDALSSQK